MNKWLIKNGFSLMIFSVGLLFIVIGISRREHIIVVKKAIAICLQCIGIG